MNLLDDIAIKLEAGQVADVLTLVKEGLDQGIDAKKILDEGLLKGMNSIGVKFKNNEVFIPEVLVAAMAMNQGTTILKPYLGDSSNATKGKVVIGTVKGDLHDIGKNLVKIMFEAKGLEIYDLGVDVAPDRFIDKAKEVNADIIACSALLTTTMPVMEEVAKKIKEEKLEAKMMIGGAPVNQDFCDKIGADFYTVDATSAAEKAVEICNR